MGAITNIRDEVADFWDESQFIGGKSAYECVAYCASLILYAGRPNTGPHGSASLCSSDAQSWYAHMEGSDSASNTNGMSLAAEYAMLKGMGLTYYPITGNYLATIKAWLAVGYPVMLCGAESGMYDIGLGDIVPYSWPPSGNHCIVVSGIAGNNLLVHDTASIASSGVRPGPRTYDASKLQIVSATAIAVPWLPLLPTNYNPLQGGNMATTLPAPWTDDGTTLKANGFDIIQGFRAYVLPLLESGRWNPADVPLENAIYLNPLEDSNPALGDGTQQAFKWTVLEWVKKDNQVIEMWTGQELLWLRAKAFQYMNERDAANQEIARLEALPAPSPEPMPPLVPDPQVPILEAHVTQLQNELDAVTTQAQGLQAKIANAQPLVSQVASALA